MEPNGARKILVVEDDPTMRTLLAGTLQNKGYQVTSAPDGEQGLTAARADPPDLILSDLLMPVMDGITLLNHVRQEPGLQNVIFILLSARSDLQAKLIGFDSGADDFLAKPFNPQELLARIQAGLRLKHTQDILRNRNEELARVLDQYQSIQSQLIHAEKMSAIGMLAGGVAHEFNNILGGVIGYCEMALRDGAPEFTRKTLQITLTALQRACTITQTMLDFARHNECCTFAQADLTQVLDETLQLVRLDLEKCGIEVQVLAEDVPSIWIDVGRIQQVFLNMLVNARDAMYGVPDARLDIRVGRRQEDAMIQFVDNGKGIAPEHLDHIFDPFFTTKTTPGSHHTPGTGLGLSVSDTIIREHHGRVEVESTPNHGTTFTILLPVDRNRDSHGDGASPVSVQPAETCTKASP